MTATTTTRAHTTRKVLGSLGVIGAAAAVAGMGTFGTFTDSTAPLNASVTSGTLVLDLTQPGGGTTLSVTADKFVPGDSIARPFELVNGGNLDMASIGLQVAAPVSSVLDTDRTNGLKLAIDSCPVAWSASNTCSGTTSVVLAPVAARDAATLTNLSSLAAGRTDHLLVTLSLPAAAGNDLQGKSSTLTLTFTGTQQTGTSR
jgi:hypothetical protein